MASALDFIAAIRSCLQAAGYEPTQANIELAAQLWNSLPDAAHMSTQDFISAIAYSFRARGVPKAGATPTVQPSGVAPTQPLGTTVDQAQGVDAYLNALIQELSGLTGYYTEQGQAIDLMELMGAIYPELIGAAPDEWAAILSGGGGIPTLAAQQATAQAAYQQAMLQLQQAQIELQRMLGTQQYELGMAQLQLSRELGYEGFDLQRELAELDAALQRELQTNQLELERERLDVAKEQQQFEQTMAGFKGAATPGLAAGRTPTTGIAG